MNESRRAVALGFFDGLHLGHAALLERVKERAQQLNAEPVVLTFDVHPDTLVFGKEVPLINSAPEREEIIRRVFGIDTTVFLHFNRRMMQNAVGRVYFIRGQRTRNCCRYCRARFFIWVPRAGNSGTPEALV